METEGWGARLLSCEDEDGQWAGGAFAPADFDAREWHDGRPAVDGDALSLSQLREFGLDPTSERARRAVELIGANSRWEHGGQPYWEGEVEECINGRTVADGAYFGVDVSPIVERLVGERLDDGGWNCERANGSVRSSFDTTINVLEGLLEYERASGGTAASRAARASGEEYLLERGLFRRLSTGEPADERYLRFAAPEPVALRRPAGAGLLPRCRRADGAAPDPRLGEAVDHVRSRRLEDGTWPLDWTPARAGSGSRWTTGRASPRAG